MHKKQALCIFLMNVLLRPNVVVLVTNTLQKESRCDMKEVAIKQMQPPINKQQLKFTSRYGEPLIYYRPNISNLFSDLRNLLKKDALFQWSEAHDVAFQKIKII